MLSLALLFGATLTQLGDLDSAIKAASTDRCADFCVTGTVSYVLGYHESLHHILLNGEGLGVDFHGSTETPPQTGDIIRIEGHLEPRGAGSIQPHFQQFDILKHADAPAPVSGRAEEIMSGRFDFRRAYLVGEVRDVEPSGTDPCWNYLSIISEGEQYYAPIPTRGATLEQLESLVGSTVRLDGFPDSNNCSYRFLDERRFLVSDLSCINVLKAPEGDAFKTAPSIDLLHKLPSERISRLGRHKAIGRLLTVWQDNKAILHLDDDRMVLVSCAANQNPVRGNRVEVLGYPSTDGFTLRLSRAIIRTCEAAPLDDSSSLLLTDGRIKELLDRDYYGKTTLQGRRVSLSGLLADFNQQPSETGTFQIRVADRLLDVDCSNIREQAGTLEPGSRLRITGTCVLETENWSTLSDGLHLNGIRLVIDKPEDLEILSRPPWWTPARLTVLVIVLLFILTAVIIWNRTLRRLSEKRGRELFRERSASALAELKTTERTRLAVELHDSISQILTGAAMQLDAGEIAAAKRILASCRRELRCCLWDLRSNALDAASFADSIRRILEPHLSGRSVAVDFDLPSSRMSESLRHTALSIIREAAINAIRHGHAQSIAIFGEFEGRQLTFSIIDDGRGFDPRHAPGSKEGHFGLLGMHERARAFNGSVSISSSPENGTEITVTLIDTSER